MEDVKHEVDTTEDDITPSKFAQYRGDSARKQSIKRNSFQPPDLPSNLIDASSSFAMNMNMKNKKKYKVKKPKVKLQKNIKDSSPTMKPSQQKKGKMI